MTQVHHINIHYTQPAPAKDATPVAEIFPAFPLAGSYIDTPGYTRELIETADFVVRDGGKSIYATNVEGWGTTPDVGPYAGTGLPLPFPAPLGQLDPVNFANEEKQVIKNDDGSIEYIITFDTDDAGRLYFAQIAGQVKDQGFGIVINTGDE